MSVILASVHIYKQYNAGLFYSNSDSLFGWSRDCSFICRLTPKMIPNDILVKTTDDPPRLINGKVCPVTGKKPTDTNILISACNVIIRLNPNTNRLGKAVAQRWKITIPRKKIQR